MHDVQVIINGKQYTICGYENEEYLQRVASYINNKYVEFRSMDSYSRLDHEFRNILLEINIADDYFKAKNQVEELEEENERKDNEIFDMKHKMIASQTKLEALQKDLEILRQENVEAQKKIVKLETELEERAKQEERTRQKERGKKEDSSRK